MFSLRSHTRGRLSCDNANAFSVKHSVKDWELFYVDQAEIKRKDGKATGLRMIITGSPVVYLATTEGGYLSVHQNTQQVSVAPHQQEWEVWVKETTRDQAVHELRENGFTLLKNALTRADCDMLKDALRLAEESHTPSKTGTRIGELVQLGAPFVKPAIDGLIHDILWEYLGENFRCATWSSNMLSPNSSESGLGWHVDYPYHDIPMDRWPVPLPANPLGVQVLWLLDDFREDNGGTMFLPGSHLTPQTTSGGFEDVAGQRVLEEPAGTVLIAHSAWHHRQTINRSAASRTALLGNYTPMFVTPKDSMERAWRHRPASSIDDFLSGEEGEMFANLWLGRERRGNYGEQ